MENESLIQQHFRKEADKDSVQGYGRFYQRIFSQKDGYN